MDEKNYDLFAQQIGQKVGLQIEKDQITANIYKVNDYIEYTKYHVFYYIKLNDEQFQQLKDDNWKELTQEENLQRNYKEIYEEDYDRCKQQLQELPKQTQIHQFQNDAYIDNIRYCQLNFYKVDNNNKIFLIENDRYYHLKKYFYEDVLKTAIREFKEETGKDVNDCIEECNKNKWQENFVYINPIIKGRVNRNVINKTFVVQVKDNFDEKQFQRQEQIIDEFDQKFKLEQEFSWFQLKKEKYNKISIQQIIDVQNQDQIEIEIEQQEICTKILDGLQNIYNKIDQVARRRNN